MRFEPDEIVKFFAEPLSHRVPENVSVSEPAVDETKLNIFVYCPLDEPSNYGSRANGEGYYVAYAGLNFLGLLPSRCFAQL